MRNYLTRSTAIITNVDGWACERFTDLAMSNERLFAGNFEVHIESLGSMELRSLG